MTASKICPHCREALPLHTDAFCPQCREDLSEAPVTSSPQSEITDAEAEQLFRKRAMHWLIAAGILALTIGLARDILGALFNLK